jgi:hypothetical protein
VGLSSSHANELRKAHRLLRRVVRHDQDAPTGNARRKAQPRISDEQAHRIAEGYLAGKTVYELAAEFGCHRVTISAILKRQGIALRLQPAAEEEVERMITLYQSGLSLAAVGEHDPPPPSRQWGTDSDRSGAGAAVKPDPELEKRGLIR